MSAEPPIDLPLAHKYFSTHCFNATWDLIDQPERTKDESIELLARTMASYWHWTQRADVTNRHRSIGCWQIARVFALADEGDIAVGFGRRCLEYAEHEEPFYKAYAYEAMARGAALCRRKAEMDRFLGEALQLSTEITDQESKQRLLADLKTIHI